MWPLLLCSLVSLTISIERVLFWWRERRRRSPRLVEEIFRHTEKGDFDSALSIGKGTLDLAARILISGLTHRDYGFMESIQVAAEDEIERMKRGLNVLDTVITLAPLLGILGTVTGIMEAFGVLSASGIEDPKAVTGGIAEALITTEAGLSIAIVTVIPFNYLVAKVQKTTQYLENVMTRFKVAYRKGLGGDDAAK